MFSARLLAIALVVSGISVLPLAAQTDSSGRPRYAQRQQSASDADSLPGPSSQDLSEAKRLYKVGVKYGRAGLFSQAAETFEQVVKLNPLFAEGYFSLGHAYSDMGQWQRAVTSLERGLVLKPENKEAIRRLAHARNMLDHDVAEAQDAPEKNGKRDLARSSHASLSARGLSPGTTKRANDVDLTKIYRVGPGDVLAVRLNGSSTAKPSLVTVTAGGFIDPDWLSSPLRCTGLTVEEIEAEVRSRQPGLTTDVEVSVSEYVSHTLIVSGLVKEPGVKIIKREAIPLYVVVADAQPLPEAENVTLLRHETNESFVFELSKPTEMNMLVRPRDVITVQVKPAEFYYLSGAVASPGEKPFRRGLTLSQALIAAGGLLKDAKEARLFRDSGTGLIGASSYKIKDIDSGKIADPRIQPGDRITIIK